MRGKSVLVYKLTFPPSTCDPKLVESWIRAHKYRGQTIHSYKSEKMYSYNTWETVTSFSLTTSKRD